MEQHRCTDSSRCDLFRELLPLANEWKNIGTLLEMPAGELDEIEGSNPHHLKDCMREMIKMWLRMIDPEPTWERLVKAMEAIDPRKAQDMKLKYIFGRQ